MSVNVIIKNMEKFRRKIVSPVSIGVMSDIARKGGTIVQMGAKMYPPKLPQQKYVRTFKLRAGWVRKRLEISGNTVTQRVSNGVRYARYVQLEGWQNRYHINRWYTTRQIMDGNREPIVKYALDRIRDAFSRGR